MRRRSLVLGLALLAPALHGQALVADINRQPNNLPDPGSSPREFRSVGAQTFFTAEDALHGRELWVTDGTSSGTHMVVDLAPGSGSSSPTGLIELGGALCFSIGGGLWRSDG